MTKSEFLEALRNALSQLPQNEIEKSIAFYEEMVDDRIEEGMTEEEAVSGFEDAGAIAKQIMLDLPLGVLVKSKVKPQKNLSDGVKWLIIALLVLGFPVWFPISLSMMAVIFSVYVVIWSVIAVMFVTVLSIGIFGIACIIASVFAFPLNIITAFAAIGGGLVLVGLSIFVFFPAKYAAKGLVWLTWRFARCIKSLFIRREAVV
ncbi:MAG: DUF1700 domain-containing protein [Oscillospiraceae bacterium]